MHCNTDFKEQKERVSIIIYTFSILTNGMLHSQITLDKPGILRHFTNLKISMCTFLSHFCRILYNEAYDIFNLVPSENSVVD